MKAYFEGMKDIEICEPVVTIKSVMKDADEENMKTLQRRFLHKEEQYEVPVL